RGSGGARMASLVVGRRDVAQRRVPPAGVVEALDKVEHGHLGLGLGPEPLLIEELALECGEEALAHRVVVRIADRAHRGPDADLLAAEAERDGRVLGCVPWSL